MIAKMPVVRKSACNDDLKVILCDISMKKDIHPQYKTAKAECACGKSFIVGSVKERLEIEICSNCHPFYTGGSKLVDTAGRVEKFKKRLAQKRP